MVTYLLDTHVLVRASATPERLGAAQQVLRDPAVRLLVAQAVAGGAVLLLTADERRTATPSDSSAEPRTVGAAGR